MAFIWRGTTLLFIFPTWLVGILFLIASCVGTVSDVNARDLNSATSIILDMTPLMHRFALNIENFKNKNDEFEYLNEAQAISLKFDELYQKLKSIKSVNSTEKKQIKQAESDLEKESTRVVEAVTQLKNNNSELYSIVYKSLTPIYDSLQKMFAEFSRLYEK